MNKLDEKLPTTQPQPSPSHISWYYCEGHHNEDCYKSYEAMNQFEEVDLQIDFMGNLPPQGNLCSSIYNLEWQNHLNLSWKNNEPQYIF